MSVVETGSATIAYEYASALLDQVAAIVAATDGGAIERQFVAPGLPSLDCDTIAVWGTNLGYLSRTAQSPVDAGHTLPDARVPLFGFGVIIARCIPISIRPDSEDPPSPTQQDAAAQIMLQDGWAVWNGIVELFAAGSLFGGTCSELFMDSATALDPQGGIGGWNIQLRAALPGYQPGS